MARPLRIQFPGALYHVTNRGNNRESLFKDDDDRKTFLDILAGSVDTYQIQLHSFVLMSNHWHFLVQTPLANRVLGSMSYVSWVKQTYLDQTQDRERPGVSRISKHVSLEQVLTIIEEESGQSDLFGVEGALRQLVMTFLYNYSALNNREIGERFGVDYSTVSQSRKRFMERLKKGSQLESLAQRISERLSRIKI